MMNSSSHLFQAALEIQDFFERNDWKFAFIGGLSNLRWGQYRTTEDVDGTVLTFFMDEEKIVDKILARFESRISAAKEFAMNNRVLLLSASNGVGMDVSLGGFSFEEKMVERSSLFSFEEESVLRTCSAEDLIVLKAFAARDKDWADIRAILERQKGKLNMDLIFESLTPLCELKESPEIIVRLKRMINIQPV